MYVFSIYNCKWICVAAILLFNTQLLIWTRHNWTSLLQAILYVQISLYLQNRGHALTFCQNGKLLIIPEIWWQVSTYTAQIHIVFGQCHLKRSLRSLQITCSLLLVSGPLRNNILPREDRPSDMYLSCIRWNLPSYFWNYKQFLWPWKPVYRNRAHFYSVVWYNLSKSGAVH
jgi:hypothetical protein